jgi:hypothetical protein
MGRHWSNVSRYNADSEPSIEKKSVSSSRSTPPGTSRSKRGHQGVAFGDVDKDGAGVDQIEVLLGKPVPNLRHTHATLLLRAGVPVKVVSERLGHANPAFTMTVYQHVIPGMQEEAASLFSDLIFGRDESALAPAP